MIEEASPNGIEARYSIVVEEFVEDEWWKVGAKVCGVVDNVAGDLLQRMLGSYRCGGGSRGVRANLLQGANLQLKPHGTCQWLCTCDKLEPGFPRKNCAYQQ